MKLDINEGYDYYEKEEIITWEEVKDKIPKFLKLIRYISVKNLENKDNNIDALELLKEFDLGIKEEEPYIFNLSDIDDINFYKYILKLFFFSKTRKN